ncbi:MAG: excisionase family DNA-binding protein [Alphaproteobacteria bacterium]|nr:excisionase family DNA-binding protein [Alphaproteobacteria bacterium]
MPSASTSPALLRPTEVFELLGIGRTLGYRLLRDGTIPSVRIGRALRVPADAVSRIARRGTADADR